MAESQRDIALRKLPTVEVEKKASPLAKRQPANADLARGDDGARNAQAEIEEEEALKRQKPEDMEDDPEASPEAQNPEVAETRATDAAILH